MISTYKMLEELGPPLPEKTKVDGRIGEIVYKQLKSYHVEEVLKYFQMKANDIKLQERTFWQVQLSKDEFSGSASIQIWAEKSFVWNIV